ncbi:hypothetical protein WAI453_009866 [Rhynchosporium graminicola]
MCYLVIERYSDTKFVNYKHYADLCAAHETQGQCLQERTMLVENACERHVEHNDEETPLWTDSAVPIANCANVLSLNSWVTGDIPITSSTAVAAMQEAYLVEDNYTSTEEAPDESAMDTASTQTTVEDETCYEAKFQSVTSQTANLDDLRSRLLHPSRYVSSFQVLKESVWRS